jgi:DNA polymerase III subunit alpha
LLDLHRHDEFSTFDGFGKALDLARLAKKKGLTALGIANHGNMNGIVEHWLACKEHDIIPVLGVEAYFQPKFNKKDPKRDSFHLCLFALNLQGYKNLNRIMTISNIEQKYYKPICDFNLLEKYSEGVICTSGCIASFVSQTIAKGKLDIARKAIKKFVSIYGRENYYIELQPYKLDERTPDEKNLQERVNVQLVKFAKEFKLKMVLTSDSHYGNELDYDTYCKMHEIKGSGEFNETYRERYMPNEKDLVERFVKVHKKDFKDARKIAMKAVKGLDDIENRVDPDILGKLDLELPNISNDSATTLKKDILKGTKKKLKERGVTSKKILKEYMERMKQEYEVIVHHGFEDYFLIVADYTKYAKDLGIKVGPGRGSVCNSAVAWALDITEVDSHFFGLDFTRFLRMDKKKLPDVDLDFETDRRQEVIDYIVNKYPGKAAQICSYGLYKVDNLLNDLAKVCKVGRVGYDSNGKEKFEVDRETLKEIKTWVNSKIEDDVFNYSKVERDGTCRMYNKLYDNIILHFAKMFKKVRYIGTHAAGVAVVGGDLLDYTSLVTTGNKEKGTYRESTAYDLNNLEHVNAIKFDILGLRTLSITKELEELTDECFSYDWLEDEEVYDYFRDGKTDGIFQFEKPTAKGILTNIHTDSFADVVAASALNRPGPLSLKMPDQYAHNKESGNFGNEAWSDFTNKTYGTIVYQEQITAICREIGLMEPSDADKVLKFMKGTQMTESALRERDQQEKRLRGIFQKGAKKTRGLSKQQADELFDKITVYSFNEGHSTGYSLVSLQQMWYKVKYPEFFWYTTLKYAANEGALEVLKITAVKEGNVILLPHVNYGAEYTIVTIEGENALAEGLSNVKRVGEKAARAIEDERIRNGPYKSRDDFMERVPKRQVNAGVIKALEEAGSLVFDKKTYFKRVQKYNSTLYMKGLRSK